MDADDPRRVKAVHHRAQGEAGPLARGQFTIGSVLTRRQSIIGAGTAIISMLVGAWGCGATAAGSASPSASPPSFDGSNGFVLLSPVRQAPAAPLLRLDRSATNLAKFRGKAVLINFWASWCAPCVAELPRLERLSISLANEPVEVAAISVDREGAEVVEPFVRRLGLRHLHVYLDPAEHVGHLKIDNPNGAAFPLYRMPISYLIDRSGMIRGYVPGAAPWDTEHAAALLRRYMQ